MNGGAKEREGNKKKYEKRMFTLSRGARGPRQNGRSRSHGKRSCLTGFATGRRIPQNYDRNVANAIRPSARRGGFGGERRGPPEMVLHNL